MTASIARDDSPAISQDFRKRGPAGVAAGGFGTRTTGAAGSIRAVSIATGLFTLRTPPVRPSHGHASGPARRRLDTGQIPPIRRKWAETARRARPLRARLTAPVRYPSRA